MPFATWGFILGGSQCNVLHYVLGWHLYVDLQLYVLTIYWTAQMNTDRTKSVWNMCTCIGYGKCKINFLWRQTTEDTNFEEMNDFNFIN